MAAYYQSTNEDGRGNDAGDRCRDARSQLCHMTYVFTGLKI